MRFINFCITCHQTALSTPQSPQLPDKKAVAEFAYLALITRSVSSVINEVGGRGRRRGVGGGHRIQLIMSLKFIICMFISVVRTQSEAVDVFPRFFFPQNISVITYSYKVCNLNEIETRLHLLFSLSQNLLMLCFSNRYSFTFFSRPK